jgi:hypothetical protein
VVFKRSTHVSGNKVTSLDVHPLDSNLLLTAGNDHFCKLFDTRMLKEGENHVGKCARSSFRAVCSFLEMQCALVEYVVYVRANFMTAFVGWPAHVCARPQVSVVRALAGCRTSQGDKRCEL